MAPTRYVVSFLRPKKAKYPTAAYEIAEASSSEEAVQRASVLLIYEHGTIMANYKRVDVKEV